jgi:hypothetical protein
MNGKRLATFVLAGSLGLNLALGGILIYGSLSSDSRRGDRQSRDSRGRSYWQDRHRSTPDSLREAPRFSREQIDQLRGMRRAMEEETAPLREEVRDIQSLIRNELRTEEPRLAYLDSLASESMKRQSAIQSRALRLILEEREILGPEHYERFLRYMVPGGSYGRGDSRSRGPERGSDNRRPPDPGRHR